MEPVNGPPDPSLPLDVQLWMRRRELKGLPLNGDPLMRLYRRGVQAEIRRLKRELARQEASGEEPPL